MLVDAEDNILLIDFEHHWPADSQFDRDGPSVVNTVYECLTGRMPWDDGEKDWVQLPERVRRRAAYVLAKRWELKEPRVEIDVDVDLLKDLLQRWVVQRDVEGFSWPSFVDGLPYALADLVREAESEHLVHG